MSQDGYSDSDRLNVTSSRLREHYPRKAKRLPLWAQIAIGIILGFTVLGIGGAVIKVMIAKAALQELSRSVEKAQAEQALRLEKNKAEQALREQRAAMAKEQMRQMALADLKRRTREEMIKRDTQARFEAWYTENMPEECKQETMGELNVECVNHRIRAKRAFKN